MEIKDYCVQVYLPKTGRGWQNLANWTTGLSAALDRCAGLYEEFGCWLDLYEKCGDSLHLIHRWPTIDSRRRSSYPYYPPDSKPAGAGAAGGEGEG